MYLSYIGGNADTILSQSALLSRGFQVRYADIADSPYSSDDSAAQKLNIASGAPQSGVTSINSNMACVCCGHTLGRHGNGQATHVVQMSSASTDGYFLIASLADLEFRRLYLTRSANSLLRVSRTQCLFAGMRCLCLCC